MQDPMSEYMKLGYIEQFERDGIAQRAKSIQENLYSLSSTDEFVIPTRVCFFDAIALLGLKVKKQRKTKGLHVNWRRCKGLWVYKNNNILWPTKRNPCDTTTYRFCVSENIHGDPTIESQYKAENGQWVPDCLWNLNGGKDFGSLYSAYSFRPECLQYWAESLKNYEGLPNEMHEYMVQFSFKGAAGNEELLKVSFVTLPRSCESDVCQDPLETVGCVFCPGFAPWSHPSSEAQNLNKIENIFSYHYDKGESLCFTLGKEGKVVAKEEKGVADAGPMFVRLNEDKNYKLMKQKGVVFDDRLGGVKVLMCRTYEPFDDCLCQRVRLVKETIIVCPRDSQKREHKQKFDDLAPEYADGGMMIRIFDEDGALRNCRFENAYPTVLFDGPRLEEYRTGLLFADGNRACVIDPDKRGAVCAVLIRNKVQNQAHRFTDKDTGSFIATDMLTNEVRLILHMDADSQRLGFHKISGVSYKIVPTTWQNSTDHNAMLHGFLSVHGDSEQGHVFVNAHHYVDCADLHMEQCDGVEMRSHTENDTLRLPDQGALWRHNNLDSIDASNCEEKGLVFAVWDKLQMTMFEQVLGLEDEHHRSAVLIVAEILAEGYVGRMIKQTPVRETKQSNTEDPLMTLREHIEGCTTESELLHCVTETIALADKKNAEISLKERCNELEQKAKAFQIEAVQAKVEVGRAEQRFRDEIMKVKQDIDITINEKCKEAQESFINLINEKDKMIESYKQTLEERDKIVKSYKQTLEQRDEAYKELKDACAVSRARAKECDSHLKAAMKRNVEMDERLEHVTCQCSQLENELQALYNRMHATNLSEYKDEELQKLKEDFWAALGRVQTQQQENLCREKEELIRRAEENSEARKCVVCFVNDANVHLYDCDHMCVCVECCPKLGVEFAEHGESQCAADAKCPVCRMPIVNAIKVYLP